MSTYGNQPPPNPGPGQYGSPQPPAGDGSYGGTTYGSPSGGAPYGGGTYGAAPTSGGGTYGPAPTSGGTYGAAPTSGGGTYGPAPTSGGTYGSAPAGGPQYGGNQYGGNQYGGAPYGAAPVGAPGGAPYGGGPAGGPPPYGQPPQQQGTNGLSIAGLVLAFIIAPVGFILSIIGLVQAGKRGQKGKGLALAGIIVSLVLMIGSGVLVAAAASKVTKLADPGCTTGKSAVLDNQSKVSNPDTIKDGLTATIAGLNSAASKAKHDDVRDAMKALADDYSQMLNAINTATPPSSELTDKIVKDGEKVDSLCSITTK
jgi:hypothetical protein